MLLAGPRWPARASTSVRTSVVAAAKRYGSNRPVASLKKGKLKRDELNDDLLDDPQLFVGFGSPEYPKTEEEITPAVRWAYQLMQERLDGLLDDRMAPESLKIKPELDKLWVGVMEVWLQKALDDPLVLPCGAKAYLLGTIHHNFANFPLVQKAFDAVQPDVLALEQPPDHPNPYFNEIASKTELMELLCSTPIKSLEGALKHIYAQDPTAYTEYVYSSPAILLDPSRMAKTFLLGNYLDHSAEAAAVHLARKHGKLLRSIDIRAELLCELERGGPSDEECDAWELKHLDEVTTLMSAWEPDHYDDKLQQLDDALSAWERKRDEFTWELERGGPSDDEEWDAWWRKRLDALRAWELKHLAEINVLTVSAMDAFSTILGWGKLNCLKKIPKAGPSLSKVEQQAVKALRDTLIQKAGWPPALRALALDPILPQLSRPADVKAAWEHTVKCINSFPPGHPRREYNELMHTRRDAHMYDELVQAAADVRAARPTAEAGKPVTLLVAVGGMHVPGIQLAAAERAARK